MKYQMSLVEEECRMSIAIAYAEWQWKWHSKTWFSLIAYENAIGLDFPF